MQMPPQFTLLLTIFSMSSETLRLTRATLVERLGMEPRELEGQLVALERAGFIDARRVRLTFSGLAVAVTMRASSASSRQVARVAA